MPLTKRPLAPTWHLLFSICCCLAVCKIFAMTSLPCDGGFFPRTVCACTAFVVLAADTTESGACCVGSSKSAGSSVSFCLSASNASRVDPSFRSIFRPEGDAALPLERALPPLLVVLDWPASSNFIVGSTNVSGRRIIALRISARRSSGDNTRPAAVLAPLFAGAVGELDFAPARDCGSEVDPDKPPCNEKLGSSGMCIPSLPAAPPPPPCLLPLAK